jgi:glycosyltransferase involved in cell wall biosynthesis
VPGLRVLFVSKPIAPPWHDGSKNLVRDVATHLVRAHPTVLTTPGAPSLGPRVAMEAVYRESGRFAPALLANARVLTRLATGDAHDAWHFVFAPNPASSSAARVARGLRRTTGWRGTVLQTVASAPRSFDGIGRWIFGDKVVALSEWMRARLVANGVRADRVRVIAPCAAAPAAPSPAARARVREEHGLGEGPLVVYPGDYEVSTGARTVAEAAASILRKVPEATIVFACRAKSPGAATAEALLVARTKTDGVDASIKHVGEIADLPALLAEASVVAFPVDDLYGKVDLPLVLLESLALGVPLVLAKGGPLEAIASARFVEPQDAEGLAREIVTLLKDAGAARDTADRGRVLYEARFHPRVVAARYDELYDEVLAAGR